MNKQREALELALDALIEVTGWQWVGPMRVMDEVEDAIAAIREALAEPEPEPVARVKTVGGYPDASEHTVEWLVKFKNVMSGQLLYTAPPARKPLTDTEIDALFNSQAWVSVVFCDAYGKPLERASSRDFARAIERAHGIGGEE